MIGVDILNLARRKDRYYTMVGHLQTIGVPFDVVRFHKGVDGIDYSSPDEACDAAMVDGFPGFDRFRDQGSGTICGTWSALRVLRYIASDEYPFKFSYFNYDDKLLKLNYKEFIALIKHINLFHKGPVRILQLQPDTSIVNAVPISPDSYICKGIHSGGDSGLVLSKEGCLLLLESFQKRPTMLQYIMGKLDPSLPGTYSVRSKFNLITNVNVRYFNKSSQREDQDREIINDISLERKKK